MQWVLMEGHRLAPLTLMKLPSEGPRQLLFFCVIMVDLFDRLLVLRKNNNFN